MTEYGRFIKGWGGVWPLAQLYDKGLKQSQVIFFFKKKNITSLYF